jgi:CRP/FNR family cyclic AMP-dependent transcriptional regulator
MVSIEVLRSFPHVAGVSSDSLKAVAAITEELAFKAGEPLFKEGDSARALYILREGQVDIVYQLQGDEGHVVDTVVGGDLIGWSSLVEPYRCTATAVPRQDGRTVRIEATGIRDLCARDQSLGYHVLKELCATLSRRLQGALVQLAVSG